ncbi:TonB-dependent receptor [Sphingomonas sp. Tas61C01]|uniref:TonB-dependent receptor n=1 Tax=Sphingomonas sp. Tas61C01 TaxID=3458297 RepID=UPI00403EA043
MATSSTASAPEFGFRGYGKWLKSGASVGALCAFSLAAPAFAQTGSASGQGTVGTATSTAQPQDGPTAGAQAGQPADVGTSEVEANGDDIVVTGIRQSLANAQAIKRNADTVVDAITAQDIGALPDRSVTEALQRVPGVSINRFAGSNDPDHFSVEGSGVVVRGLNFVRSEFNGRDAFAAGVGGQALNFADVPAELLGSVEVYKNATADLIEGGLAGTVNLNTRKPFDNPGFHIGVDAEANYGDFRKKWTPTGSLLLSDTWDTGVGRFGLLGSVSYSRLKSRADGIQVTNYQTRDNTFAQSGTLNAGTAIPLVCRNPLPSGTDTVTLPPANALCGATGAAGADGFSDFLANAYAPIGGQFRSQDFDRKRQGIAVAAQWESTDQRTTATAQYLRSHSTQSWGEHTFETAPDLSEYNTYPAGCQQNQNGSPRIDDSTTTPITTSNPGTRAECPVGSLQNYVYDDDGLFQSGIITLPGAGWRTAGSGSATTTVPTGGIQQSLSRRGVYESNTVEDYGFNLKFNPTEKLSINLDADYTKADRTQRDFSVFNSTFADQELDTTGKLPVVIPHRPLTLAAAWAAPSIYAGQDDATYFQDPRATFYRAAMDHFEESAGSEYQVKADATYKFDDGSFLNRVKFGARYAERQQTVKYTAYNWGAISEVWSGAPVTIAQGGVENAEFYKFPNFFRGDTPGPIGGYYYGANPLDNYDKTVTDVQALNDLWRSANGATASNRFVPAAGRDGTVNGSYYLPGEIQTVNQQDVNAYGMLNFGSQDPLFGPVRVSGNIGVRYVHTSISSSGAFALPTRAAFGITDPFTTRCVASVPAGAPAGTPAQVPGGICRLGAAGYGALQQFATGAITPDVARTDYTYWLPSANLKLGLSDELIMRFAASKVLTRPDAANIRNYQTYSTDPSSGTPTATSGNPFLKPATAWQFDATLEWYFARVGSLTFDAFYKEVSNFFYQSIASRNVTSNGVTQSVQFRFPENFTGKGKIKGFEVAYQQTLDFLPGLLNGFGINANYSYIDSSGLPNSFLNTGSPQPTSTIPTGDLPFEGLSKHNVNATVFYEKGPVSLRAAYNWRSKYLLTAADVIFPYTSIFQDDTGSLDASAFINVNKWIKVGVQGVNLTNTVTKTLQAYTGDPGKLAPRSYFMNDRRYSFILRGNF